PAASFSWPKRWSSRSSPARRPKSSSSCSVIFRQAPSSRNTSTRPFLWGDAWMRSIRIVEVVGAHIHRPARRLGGDAGLVAHQLVEVFPNVRLQLFRHLRVLLEVPLGGVPAL